MKILLLTDIPPCHNFTAGLVTAQMSRILHPGEAAAFVVLHRELNPVQEPDLAWMPTSFITKPNEQGISTVGRFDLGEFGVWINETQTRLTQTPRLIDEAVQFGLLHRVDRVCAVLQGQTMVRISRRVARRLGVPLHTIIWDPLSWWHRARNIDRVTRWLDEAELKRTLRESVMVAAPSHAMAEKITSEYRTPSVPIIASVSRDVSREPPIETELSETITIGMAGQFYAHDAWMAFCAALEQNDWKIAGRSVRLKTLGGGRPPNTIPDEIITYYGWLEQSDAVNFLSKECDILYCPYPFAEEMEEVSRLSFPSKVVIYLASGRPIFFHGPEYSSPGRYLRKHTAGLTCSSLASQDIRNMLEQLVGNPELRNQFTTNGRRAFLQDFTLERQRELSRAFFTFEGKKRNALTALLSSSFRRKLSNRKLKASVLRNAEFWLSHDALDPWGYQVLHPEARDGAQTIHDYYFKTGWLRFDRPNSWFWTDFYLSHNPDVKLAGVEPLQHYLTYGWREGRNPNPWFSIEFYLHKYADVRNSDIDPAQHYAQYGCKEGRDPNHWFSTNHYLAQIGSLIRPGDDPVRNFLTNGWKAGLSPNEWFSVDAYLLQNPSMRDASPEEIVAVIESQCAKRAEQHRRRERLQKDLDFVENALTDFVMSVQKEIDARRPYDPTVLADYFDLMDGVAKSVHRWLDRSTTQPNDRFSVSTPGR